MVYLGLKPWAAGWKAQTNPMCYGGTPWINYSKRFTGRSINSARSWLHCQPLTKDTKRMKSDWCPFRKKFIILGIKLKTFLCVTRRVSFLLHFLLRQCDQIGINFATLAKFWMSLAIILKVHLVFGKILNLLWQIFCKWANWHCCKMAKYWKTNVASWSHCSLVARRCWLLLYHYCYLPRWSIRKKS